MSTLPKAESVGEETLALHLRANKIDYEREVCLIPGRKWRVDFFFRDFRLAVEVDGGIWQRGRHSGGAGQEGDNEKMNALVLAGYFVLRYSTTQVTRGDAIRDIMQVLGASRT